MKKEEKNQEPEFEQIDVNIGFYKILDEPFEGIMLELEKREDGSEIVLCQLNDGGKVYLGGYSICKFYKHFYIEGKEVRIEFRGKETMANGRTVNQYDFYMKK